MGTEYSDISGCCNKYVYYDYRHHREECKAETYYDCGENKYYTHVTCSNSYTCDDYCPSGMSDCEIGGAWA